MNPSGSLKYRCVGAELITSTIHHRPVPPLQRPLRWSSSHHPNDSVQRGLAYFFRHLSSRNEGGSMMFRVQQLLASSTSSDSGSGPNSSPTPSEPSPGSSALSSPPPLSSESVSWMLCNYCSPASPSSPAIGLFRRSRCPVDPLSPPTSELSMAARPRPFPWWIPGDES